MQYLLLLSGGGLATASYQFVLVTGTVVLILPVGARPNVVRLRLPDCCLRRRGLGEVESTGRARLLRP